MRFHLALVLAILAAGGPARAQDDLSAGGLPSRAERDLIADSEASDTGEGSLCLGYDPALTLDQLGKALADLAKINAHVASIEGTGGIATVYYDQAEPRGKVELEVAPADQAEYGLHRCAGGGALRQAGLLAIFAAGGLVGVLLGGDEDGAPADVGVPVSTPPPSSGLPGPTPAPGARPRPTTRPPGATPVSTPTPREPGQTPAPQTTPVPQTPVPALGLPTPRPTRTPQKPPPTPRPPTPTPRPPSPMR